MRYPGDDIRHFLPFQTGGYRKYNTQPFTVLIPVFTFHTEDIDTVFCKPGCDFFHVFLRIGKLEIDLPSPGMPGQPDIFVHEKMPEQKEKGGLAFVMGSGYLPFTKTMAQSDAIQQLWKESDNYKIAYDALQYGDDSYRIANLTPVIAEFRTCIQAIMLDDQDIDESLKTFSDSVDIILNE